jgi:hypothetical protein
MPTQNIFDLTDTWNAGATNFTAIKMNVTDTASAAGSLLIDLQVGGASKAAITKTGGFRSLSHEFREAPDQASTFLIGSEFGYRAGTRLFISALAAFTWGGSTHGFGDLTLFRDAANTLAQRNGTNAQALRVYNTFTDASNYERGGFDWQASANVFRIGTSAAGTGTQRPVQIVYGSTLTFAVGGGTTSVWQMNAGGHFLAATDNSFDIGASGNNRPRNLYMGSWVRMAVTTVASLPAAATAGAGARMMVSDAASPVFGSAVSGGGAVTVPVYSTGSAWNVG